MCRCGRGGRGGRREVGSGHGGARDVADKCGLWWHIVVGVVVVAAADVGSE